MNISLVVILMFMVLLGISKTKHIFNPTNYLEKYGYLPKNVNKHAFGNQAMSSLKSFQKFTGLKLTGILDTETKKMMVTPRCGLPDVSAPKNIFSALFSPTKWTKYYLTYYFENYTPDISSVKVEYIIQKAFKVWSDVTPLKFQKIHHKTADIILKFATGDHGDSFHFDGPGTTLAHAFPPPNGDTHFDDAETFTANTTNGINLFWVAVHEFGHSLGLDHSNVKGSVMYPFYGGYQANFTLHKEDITKIRAMYGATLPTTLTPVSTTKAVCKNNLPDYLCEAWKKSGHCVNHIRVQIECQKTCARC